MVGSGGALFDYDNGGDLDLISCAGELSATTSYRFDKQTLS